MPVHLPYPSCLISQFNLVLDLLAGFILIWGAPCHGQAGSGSWYLQLRHDGDGRHAPGEQRRWVRHGQWQRLRGGWGQARRWRSITGGSTANISLGAGSFLVVGQSHGGVTATVAEDLAMTVTGTGASSFNSATVFQFDLFLRNLASSSSLTYSRIARINSALRPLPPMKRTSALLSCLLLPAAVATAANGPPAPAPAPAQLIKQSPMLSPEQELKTIELPDGYKLELVLSEPQVTEPVLCVFDGNGRMYVAEMNTYMQDIDGTDELTPKSRISWHESSKGDGVYDKHSVYLDNLLLPRMVLPLDDRVLVGVTNTNDITLNRDKDGMAGRMNSRSGTRAVLVVATSSTSRAGWSGVRTTGSTPPTTATACAGTAQVWRQARRTRQRTAASGAWRRMTTARCGGPTLVVKRVSGTTRRTSSMQPST